MTVSCIVSDTDFCCIWQQQISTKLKELALSREENAVFLNTLAEQVEDFSVTLIDQVNRKEEISRKQDVDMDAYASFLDDITESAIRFSQKKVRRHLNGRLHKK